MSGWQQGDYIGVDVESFQNLMDKFDGFLIRQVGIAATFQDAGITTLKTEGEDIESNIGTCLVNHADDSERDGGTTESQSVGQGLLLGDMS